MLKSSPFSIQVIVNICVSLLVSAFSVALFFVACQFLTDLQGLCLFASLPVCQCCQCSTGAGLGHDGSSLVRCCASFRSDASIAQKARQVSNLIGLWGLYRSGPSLPLVRSFPGLRLFSPSLLAGVLTLAGLGTLNLFLRGGLVHIFLLRF